MNDGPDSSFADGAVDVTVTGADGESIEALLHTLRLPALLRGIGEPSELRFELRLIVGIDLLPLAIARSGEVDLTPIAWDQLTSQFRRISAHLEPPVDLSELNATDSTGGDSLPTEQSHFIWVTRSHSDVMPFVAKRVGAPVAAVPLGKLTVLRSTGPVDEALSSGVWIVDLVIALLRNGDERAFYLADKAGVMRLAWEPEWRKIDPSPHEVAPDGTTVDLLLELAWDEKADEARVARALK